MTVKLIDFGFTTNFQHQSLLETYCGSSAYASPEIISGKKYSGPETDIWSMGKY
jgi:serine/threonine protein kinase